MLYLKRYFYSTPSPNVICFFKSCSSLCLKSFFVLTAAAPEHNHGITAYCIWLIICFYLCIIFQLQLCLKRGVFLNIIRRLPHCWLPLCLKAHALYMQHVVAVSGSEHSLCSSFLSWFCQFYWWTIPLSTCGFPLCLFVFLFVRVVLIITAFSFTSFTFHWQGKPCCQNIYL